MLGWIVFLSFLIGWIGFALWARRNKKWSLTISVGGGFIVGCLSLIVTAALFIPNDNKNLSSASQKHMSLATVTSEELYKLYEDNEVNADLQYKGKQIKVVGKVNNIAKDITNKSYVLLNVKGNLVFGIQCFLTQGSLSQAAKLKKSQDIMLLGRIDGKFGNVIIRDCSVQ